MAEYFPSSQSSTSSSPWSSWASQASDALVSLTFQNPASLEQGSEELSAASRWLRLQGCILLLPPQPATPLAELILGLSHLLAVQMALRGLLSFLLSGI